MVVISKQYIECYIRNNEKMHRLALRNIVIFSFKNKYFYSIIKIERVLLTLLKPVFSMLDVCTTETAHAGMASS